MERECVAKFQLQKRKKYQVIILYRQMKFNKNFFLSKKVTVNFQLLHIYQNF